VGRTSEKSLADYGVEDSECMKLGYGSSVHCVWVPSPAQGWGTVSAVVRSVIGNNYSGCL
jgi:hypothetical protein